MKTSVVVLVTLAITGSSLTGASAGPCPPAAPRNDILSNMAAGGSPARYEQRQHERAIRATYEALLAAGAAELLACAAAYNPQILQSIAPIYFGRKPQ